MALLQAYPEMLISFLCFISFYFYRRLSGRSSVPVDWPLVGMLPGLLLNRDRFHEWSTGLLRETGCTFSFRGPWFSRMNYLFTCDLADLQHVFSANFSNFPKGEGLSEVLDILGDGIFNSDGDAWKNQRTRMHGLLSNRRFRSFVASSSRDKVEKGLGPFLDRVARRGAVVDLQDVFLRLTFDMTSYLVFGVDPCSLSIEFPTNPFARAMDDAMSAIFIRHTVPSPWWRLMRRFSIGKENKLAVAEKVIDGLLAEIIAEKKKLKSLENHNDEDEPKLDLLSSYVDQQDEDISEKFLRDTTVNFMLAGRDTTGVALAWFFWLLSEHPMVELKILEELRRDVPIKERWNSDEPIMFDADELSKLVYLHAALCESLRLFPPVPFEHKGVVQPEVLPSRNRVEPGMEILIFTYSLARMEQVWGKDCMEFKPERWITEKGRVKHEPSYKFLSFNSGPRMCLGKEVAFAQMKTVAAAMVYNFKVEVLQGQVVEPKLSIILQMKNGLKAKIKRRDWA